MFDNERDREKLKKDSEKVITQLFDQILDISEVAIGDPQRYKPFRAKVLRSGNDAIRELKKLLDRHYQVKFISDKEDIVEVYKPTATIKRIPNN